MTIDRRQFINVSGTAISAALLAACNSRGPDAAQRLLRYAERKNRSIERALFRHTSMDTLDGGRLAGNALPSYHISKTVPIWNEGQRGPWSLEISGMVDRPMKLSLADLQRLPRVTERVNHYCVEGWTAVEQWTGVRVSELARLVGVRKGAEFVDFQSFDDGFHESWDRESATHPQTIVAYAKDGRFLPPAYGAPARVHSPVKLGYKNSKYLTRVVFMHERNGGYWSDQGYEWYGGT